MVRIGILSDTHLPASISDLDALGPAAAALLRTVDLVLHSGDVVLPSVLDWCAQFAEVRCSVGAHDHFEDSRAAPVVVVEHEGWRIGMVHDVEAIPPHIQSVSDLKAAVYRDETLDILVAGDSHYERLEYRDDTLLLDSGSPTFPHHRATRLGSMALLELSTDRVCAEIVRLGDTPGAPNPCTPARLELSRGGLIRGSVAGKERDVSMGAFRWRPKGAPPLQV